MNIRTAEEQELEDLVEFDRTYAGSHATIDEFRHRFEMLPETFVVAVEDGEIIGDATGKMESEGCVGLRSIAVKEGHKRQGIGTKILELFEEKARNYGNRITVASADNVEGFYQESGYEPVQIMLQVSKEEIPENYEQKDRIVDEKEVDADTRFLYADFDEYSTDLRDELKNKFNAFEVNTIYEKNLYVNLAERSEHKVDEVIEQLGERYGEFEVSEKTWEVSEEGLRRESENFRQGGYGGAGMWLSNEYGEVLLVKNKGDDAWSDPGGHHEGGESFEAAAKRETREETNVEAEITGLQGVDKVRLQHREREDEHIYNLLVVFEAVYVSGVAEPQQSEIRDLKWWSEHPENLLYEDLREFVIPAAND